MGQNWFERWSGCPTGSKSTYALSLNSYWHSRTLNVTWTANNICLWSVSVVNYLIQSDQIFNIRFVVWQLTSVFAAKKPTFFVVLMWGYDAVMTLLSPRFTFTVGADQRHVGCDNLFYCRSVGLYTVWCTGTLVCMYFEIFVFGSSCNSLFLISLPLFFYLSTSWHPILPRGISKTNMNCRSQQKLWPFD